MNLTAFDGAKFDDASYGFDSDPTVYVSPLGVEATLSHGAGTKLLREDDRTLSRTEQGKLVRRIE